MIRFEHVTYTYPHGTRPALHNLNLEIPAGQWLALAGANGAGKSTLCAAVAGFVPHHFRGDLRGRVVVDGLDTVATPLAELVTHAGYVFQNPFNQLSGAKLTVAEEVAFGLENLGVPRTEMAERVGRALALVGLSTLAPRSPYTLSGGEMQRLTLASILVMEPRVLVLDEPTAQLDAAGARLLMEAIRALVSEQGCTVVMAEQNAGWIAAYADRVVVLREGEVALDGPPRAVLASPDLDALGITAPRCTLAVRAAREVGLWPAGLELPATLDEAIAGFIRKSPTAEAQSTRRGLTNFSASSASPR